MRMIELILTFLEVTIDISLINKNLATTRSLFTLWCFFFTDVVSEVLTTTAGNVTFIPKHLKSATWQP